MILLANFSIFLMIAILSIVDTQQFNTSICGYIELNELFFFINTRQSDANAVDEKIKQENGTFVTEIYNYCHQIEIWCSKVNKIVNGSLIKIDSKGNCFSYQQHRIQFINPDNLTQGLQVIYTQNNTTSAEFIVHKYPCTAESKVGCPQVSRTTIWTYFSNNSIGYTIAIQVIGILLMILGVYMYRITLVVLGWATAFIILLSIEQTVIFIPGVPERNLANVMIITVICSFFVGYVMAYFPKAGLFCLGMWIGLIISLTLNNVALYLIYSTPQNLPLYIVLPVLCIGFGILTVCIKRKFIIFATSLIGAYICLRALSWHLGAFPNQLLYPDQYKLGLKGIVSWQFYIYVVALLILTAASSALQYWLFKKKSLKSNNGAVDLDEHFDQVQNKLENERGQLIEFENIFMKLKNQVKKPRILKKEDSDDDQYKIKKKKNYRAQRESFGQSEENQVEDSEGNEDENEEEEDEEEEEEEGSYKKSKPSKKSDLKDTLLVKGLKRRI